MKAKSPPNKCIRNTGITRLRRDLSDNVFITKVWLPRSPLSFLVAQIKQTSLKPLSHLMQSERKVRTSPRHPHLPLHPNLPLPQWSPSWLHPPSSRVERHILCYRSAHTREQLECLFLVAFPARRIDEPHCTLYRPRVLGCPTSGLRSKATSGLRTPFGRCGRILGPLNSCPAPRTLLTTCCSIL